MNRATKEHSIAWRLLLLICVSGCLLVVLTSIFKNFTVSAEFGNFGKNSSLNPTPVNLDNKEIEMIPRPLDFQTELTSTNVLSLQHMPSIWSRSSSNLSSNRSFASFASTSNGALIYVGRDGLLYLQDLRTTPATIIQLSSLVNVKTPTWSNNSGQLAFSADGADNLRCLYVLDLNSDQPPQSLICGFTEIAYPFWSPDNNHLVFYGRQPEGVDKAWMVDRSNSVVQEVAGSFIQAQYPVWLDNQRIVFPADKGGRVWSIHTANVDSPSQAQSLPGDFTCPSGCSCNPASVPLIAYPDVSTDGQKIGFIGVRQINSCSFAATLYQMPADGSESPTPVVDVTGLNGQYGWLRWSDDDQQTALVATAGDGIGRVRVVTMSTAEMQTFETKLPAPNRLEWTPNDAQLVVGYGNSGNDSSIYAVDASSGAFTLMNEGKWPEWKSPHLLFNHSISGSVIDVNDNPLEEVKILTRNGYSTTTDVNGLFSIENLISGVYTVVPVKPGYVFSPTIRVVYLPALSSEDFVGKEDESLFAHYNFNDGTAQDISGNGYDGVLSGDIKVANGTIDAGLEFDGRTGKIKTSANIDQTKDSPGVTIAAWVYPKTTSSGRHHVVSSDNSGFDWSILREGDNWYVFTGENSRNTGFKVDLDEWQHIAAVFIPNVGIKFYKDGQEISIPFINYDTSDNNIGIAHNPGYGEYFGGIIDEVYIYERALNAFEIQELYKQDVDSFYLISGIVTDSSNNPISGVRVVAAADVLVTSTETDEDGHFFMKVNEGLHAVIADKDNYTFDQAVQVMTVSADITDIKFIANESRIIPPIPIPVPTPIPPPPSPSYTPDKSKIPILIVHGWQPSIRGHRCSSRPVLLKEAKEQSYSIPLGELPHWLDQEGEFEVWIAFLDSSLLNTPSFQQNAECLNRQVEKVHEAMSPGPHASDIIIVAHSMGGLVGRACLANVVCSDHVSELYTLGSPHAGISTLSLILLGFGFSSPFKLAKFCIEQTALCQFDAVHMSTFNLIYPNTTNINRYIFVGGSANPSPSGDIIGLLDGENDGIVGKESAIGKVYLLGEYLPSDWINANPPISCLTDEVHFSVFSGYTYYDNRNGKKSQTYDSILPLIKNSSGLPSLCHTTDFMRKKVKPVDATKEILGHLSGVIEQNSSVQRQIQVDSTGNTQFFLSWTSGNLDWTLIQPDGTLITPSSTSVVHEKVEGNEFFSHSFYRFETAHPGLWTINISTDEVPDSVTAYSVLAIADSARTLTVHKNSDKYLVGETAQITVSLQGTLDGIVGATVVALINRPDGVIDTLNFSDLGHGIYKASYPVPNAGGMVMMSVKASGIDNGILFNRLALGTWSIIPDNAKFVSGITHQEIDTNVDGKTDQIVLNLPIDITEPSTYTVVTHLTSEGQLLATSAQTQHLSAGKHTLHLDFNDGIGNLTQDTQFVISKGYLVDTLLGNILIDELQENYRFVIKARATQITIWLPIAKR